MLANVVTRPLLIFIAVFTKAPSPAGACHFLSCHPAGGVVCAAFGAITPRVAFASMIA